MQKRKERKNTDLVVEWNFVNPVVVMQPVATARMRNPSEIEEVPEWAPWDHHIQKIAEEIRDPHRFIHVGNLVLVGTSNGKPWEVRSYEGCGETIEFSNPGSSWTGVRFVCSRCGTRVRFREHRTTGELSNLLLHLLLKQMVPDLPTCNYIHLESGVGGELGTIAIAQDELGINPIGGTSAMSSLGFTLMSGMNTLNSFGGFDEWLKVLLVIKHQQLEAVVKSQLPELLGPKQKGQAAIDQPRRYWLRC